MMDEKAKRRFHNYIAEWLEDKLSEGSWGSEDENTVRKVVDVQEKHVYGGYCETCAYDYLQVVIEYIDGSGKSQEYEFYGSLSELMTGK